MLTDHMRDYPGIAHLVTGKDRYVPVDSGRFDPNRIFSREGAETNLRSLNPQWPERQLRAVLQRLDRERGKLIGAPISDAVSLKDEAHPHEFFLCTSPEDYAVLARSPYNAVLQHRAPKEDDGSLSRLAARRGIRYVNLEAGLGELEKQKEMLAWLTASLSRDLHGA